LCDIYNMKKRKKKKLYAAKQKSLQQYELLSELFNTQLEQADNFKVETFLSSDMTYQQWLDHLGSASKVNSKLWDDFVLVPHHGIFALQAEAGDPRKSPAEQKQELLEATFSALDEFKVTRQHDALLRYKLLLAIYRNLLSLANRKFKKIIGKLKARLRGRFHSDRRGLLRALTKMISSNTDDEEHSNGDFLFLIIKSPFLIVNVHENARYISYHRQPGILFGGRHQETY